MCEWFVEICIDDGQPRLGVGHDGSKGRLVWNDNGDGAEFKESQKTGDVQRSVLEHDSNAVATCQREATFQEDGVSVCQIGKLCMTDDGWLDVGSAPPNECRALCRAFPPDGLFGAVGACPSQVDD